ncbi:MAG: O-antigen ligase family protein, partial [Bacteroidia bacterium]
VAPLISSFATDNYLSVMEDGEYKSLIKILFFGPCLYFALVKKRDFILNIVILFYVVLAFYFLYRYFILHEAREYDSRPLLHIRHGDPNFLCTFFSMMAPLALAQAWRFFKSKSIGTSIALVFSAVLFILCAFVTQSRMGIIALLSGLLVLMTGRFSSSPNEKIIKSLLILTVSIVSVVFIMNSESLSKRFAEINDKSSVDRIYTYENGLRIYLNKPVFGCGMHQAKNSLYENSHHYPLFQSDSPRLEIHNTFLSIIAELGTFGFLVFCGFFIWTFSLIRRAVDPMRQFLFSSLLILFLSALTIGISYKDLVLLHFFVLAGIAQVERKEKI